MPLTTPFTTGFRPDARLSPRPSLSPGTFFQNGISFVDPYPGGEATMPQSLLFRIPLSGESARKVMAMLWNKAEWNVNAYSNIQITRHEIFASPILTITTDRTTICSGQFDQVYAYRYDGGWREMEGYVHVPEPANRVTGLVYRTGKIVTLPPFYDPEEITSYGMSNISHVIPYAYIYDGSEYAISDYPRDWSLDMDIKDSEEGSTYGNAHAEGFSTDSTSLTRAVSFMVWPLGIYYQDADNIVLYATIEWTTSLNLPIEDALLTPPRWEEYPSPDYPVDFYTSADVELSIFGTSVPAKMWLYQYDGFLVTELDEFEFSYDVDVSEYYTYPGDPT